MKKVFSILMVAFFAMGMAACGNANGNGNGNGDNNDNNDGIQEQGAAPESLTRTKWFYENEFDTYRLTISVEDNANLYFTNARQRQPVGRCGL